MIEHLKGLHETVDYKVHTSLRLYDNIEAEDYPAHWHIPLEIIMPLSGDYTVIVGDTIQHLNTSDIIFISPGVIHTLKAPPIGRRIIFQADLTALRVIKEFEAATNLISPTITITSSSHPELHKIIQDKLFEIFNEYNSIERFSDLSIYSKLLEIFVCLGRIDTIHSDSFVPTRQMPKEYIEKFMQICSYISEHCTEDLSLDDIAQLAGFSKYHFARLFKQFTNITFYKYLTQKRIAYAEQLLINPKLSITEVAMQSGFYNQSAFIRMFKLIKSHTPTEFRNMYSKF